MADSHKPKLSDDELLELGKKLQTFYDSGYVNRNQAFLFSFLKGMASGAGAFIGGTILIALLLWVLSRFNHLPIIGPLTNTINHSLHKSG